MAERYLRDTSAVIKYLNETFPPQAILFLDEIVAAECIISFITQIELLVWKPPNVFDLAIYQTFVKDSIIIGSDNDIIEQAILIRKMPNLKLPDAMIAATAIVYDFTLIADNDGDFKKVTGLKYLNPLHSV